MKYSTNSGEVFILTRADDYHAAAVSLALRRADVNPSLFFSSDYPSNACASVQFDERGSQVRVNGRAAARPRVVWFRRYDGPVLSSPIAREDRPIALRESRSFLKSLLSEISVGAVAINDVEHAASAEVKTKQLRTALEVGFRIPATLISNDPEEIQTFIAAQRSGAIYKMFRISQWRRDNIHVLTQTSSVSLEDLPSPTVLQAAPGIYQERVPKAFELRVTCFGGTAIAVRLNSQQAAGAEVDWRVVSASLLALQPFRLPPGVEAACLDLLRKLGLAFGAIDLIVRPDGEYVFLEINEMGQFLWKEILNPNVDLLRPFTQYLLSCAGINVPLSSLPPLAEIADQTAGLVREFSEQHRIAEVERQIEIAEGGATEKQKQMEYGL